MSIETDGPGTVLADEARRAEDSAPALNREILDCLTVLVKRFGAVGHTIAAGLGIAPPDLLALFKLDGPLPMKDLAQRMGVDASFVTVVTDTLEKRGFVRREPSQRDRRVKNLVLTDEGATAKERMFRQIAARMPWCYALDDAERACFLSLLRKMLDAPSPDPGPRDEAGEPQTSATVTAGFTDCPMPGLEASTGH
jgi:DNA-binding MarR family transcriptional regulator